MARRFLILSGSACVLHMAAAPYITSSEDFHYLTSLHRSSIWQQFPYLGDTIWDAGVCLINFKYISLVFVILA